METMNTDQQSDTIDNEESVHSWNRQRTSEELFSFVNSHHELLFSETDLE